MKLPLFSLRLVGTVAALVAFVLPNAEAQVHVSLVAAETSVQPGKALTVALHLEHDPHWHTYWLNPGTGLATSLAWTLPAGWKAGDIQWPTPEALTDDTGAVVGNGYNGDVFLPIVLTPSLDAKLGSTIVLKAKADWLVCKDQCMPGSADLQLTLPVSASSPVADETWGAPIQTAVAALPGADPDWTVSASRDAKNVTLKLTPRATVTHRPQSLHFFADDNYVAYDQPQGVKDDGKGAIVLTLPISPDAPKDTPKLLGVVSSATGWQADGSHPGLRIEVAFHDGKATVALPAAAASAPATTVLAAPMNSTPATGGLLRTLLLAFVGGLILNLMPCVFPVLGLKILGFVNQSGAARGKVVAHGLMFAAGVLFSFWVLAGLLILLRAGGSQLGWGFQLQSPVFIFLLAVGLLVFALNLSGVFEFGLSATAVGGKLQTSSGYAGSFFTGLLATVVATPCSAPFLAPALGAALALSPASSLAVFTVIGVGLSTPYLVLSAFPSAVRLLPRPGKWMETFKQLMAFPLYGTVGYLLWVLAAETSEAGPLAAMLGLVLVAMGAWTYGRWGGFGAPIFRARFALVISMAIMGLGCWTGWPRKPVPDSVVWEKWSSEAVEKLRAAGRPVYVDFTARWCATCQANKRIVFHSQKILETFHDEQVATLRGDWTNNDPQITAELARFGRSAVPFNLIWLPHQDKPILLPELLDPEIVLKALQGENAKVVGRRSPPPIPSPDS